MTERLLSRVEVAAWLDTPPKTLAAWAYAGRGPRYALVGKHARYDPGDVRVWLEARKRDPEARP
jgi:hypothetical protein